MQLGSRVPGTEWVNAVDLLTQMMRDGNELSSNAHGKKKPKNKKPSFLMPEPRTRGCLGSSTGLRDCRIHTCTAGLCARPCQVGLTHTGRAPLELVTTDAGELTGGPIVITITRTLHVAIFWGIELATASDCKNTSPQGSQC